MAITFGATKSDTTTGSSIAFTNDGNFLLIAVSSTSNDLTSVLYNGVAMTQIGTAQNHVAYSRYLTVWGLVNPTNDASSHNITFTGGANRYLNIVSVLGVDTANAYTGLATTSGTGANPTIGITTTTNNAYVFAAGIIQTGSSAGTNTSLVLDTTGSEMKSFRSTSTVDTTSFTVNINSTSGEYQIKGFGINPSGGSPATVLPRKALLGVGQ